jgi:hypothetical protein
MITSFQVGGSSNPDSVSYQNVVKLDKNLNIKWHYRHPITPGYDLNFTGITELANGSVVILSSGLSVNANATYHLLRFSKTGQLMQTLPFTSNICQKVVLQEGVYLSDSTVYAVGWCYRNNTINRDAYITRLSIGQVVTGFKDEVIKAASVKVYPNPATDAVTFELSEGSREARLELYNSSGKRETLQQLRSQKSEISLEKLRPGLYYYRVQTGRNVYSGKLVKE